MALKAVFISRSRTTTRVSMFFRSVFNDLMSALVSVVVLHTVSNLILAFSSDFSMLSNFSVSSLISVVLSLLVVWSRDRPATIREHRLIIHGMYCMIFQSFLASVRGTYADSKQ